jgi:nucleotide-binding universal stress UspA family protein
MTLLKPRANPDYVARQERQSAERYLERLARQLRADGAAVQYEVPVGVPQNALVREARKWKAELIALTTHGRGGLQRVVLGSVADAVVRRAPCPVLVVR